MKLPVYLDHHATTPCDPGIIDLMMPYWGAEKFGNAHAKNNHHGHMAAQVLKSAKGQIADLINAPLQNIVLTSGASEANALALQTISPQDERNEILISAIEHASILDQIPFLTQHGFNIKILPCTKEGIITPDSVTVHVTDKTIMACIMLVNHEIGAIQPVAEIANILRARNVLLHCDATQAVGKIPVDVTALGADSISFSAHKIYGPQGIGALYTKNQTVKRAGTPPLALAVGFGAACALAKQRMEEDSMRLGEMACLLLQLLPEFQINGGGVAGLLNLTLPGIDAEDYLLELSDDLSLSTGAACASGTGKPSTVLRAMGLDDIAINSSIRISIGRHTTREDIIYAAEKMNLIYLQMTSRNNPHKKSALL